MAIKNVGTDLQPPSDLTINYIPEIQQQSEKQQQTGNQIQQQQIQPPDNIEIAFVPNEQETWGKWATRNVINAGKEVASALFGLTGNITEGVKKLKNITSEKYGPNWNEALNKIAKEESPETAKATREMLETFGIKGVDDAVESIIGLPTLPTSKNIHNLIEGGARSLFGIDKEYWTPKGEGEKTLREYTRKVTNYMNPIIAPVTGIRSFALPLIGIGGKKVAKFLGASDFISNVIGEGAEMLAYAIDPYRLEKKISNTFESAETALKGNNVGRASKLKSFLIKEENAIKEIGDLTKADKWKLDRIEGLFGAIEGNKINAKKLWDLKKNFNRHVGEFSGEFKTISPFIKKTSDAIKDTFIDFGKESNPIFLKNYLDANSIFSAAQKSNSISKAANSIKDFSMIGGMLGKGAAFIGKVLKGIASITGVPTIAEATKIFIKSNAAKKYYMKSLGAAGTNSIKKMSHIFPQMDKALEKEFPGLTDYVKAQE